MALALLAAVASASMGMSKNDATTIAEVPEPEPAPIDVSIPYDATVVLAYQKAFGAEPDLRTEKFQQFKKLYIEQSVLEVSLKQKAKAMDALLSTSQK